MKMKILITGGAGFIGSNLAMHLQEKYPEYEVVVFDIFNNSERLSNGNNKFLGSYKNLIGFKGQIICGDISSSNDLEKLKIFNFSYIFHFAAISDTRADNESLVLKNNLNSYYNIIDLAKSMNSKLIYASSAAVYGDNTSNFKIGNENPNNIYAFSKHQMDQITIEELNNNKIQIVGLRFFNVYGKNEEMKGKTSSTILQFARQIQAGKSPVLFESSEKIFRDFIYIDDVIQGVLKAAFSDAIGIYNIGSGVSRSFKDVVDIIQNELKSNLPISYIKNPYSEGYQFFTEADISKSMSCFNYDVKYSLELGIREYLKSIKIINNDQ
jgi:ADP-L-glycero-D-manno-heptose 6-epimerase